jgi:hypothetical protein
VVVLLFAVVAPVMIVLAHEAVSGNIHTPFAELLPEAALQAFEESHPGVVMIPLVLLAPYTLGWGVMRVAGRWVRVPIASATSSGSES